MCEVAHVLVNALPLLGGFGSGSEEMRKGNLRPVDTVFFVVPEERTDGIDEKQLHVRC